MNHSAPGGLVLLSFSLSCICVSNLSIFEMESLDQIAKHTILPSNEIKDGNFATNCDLSSDSDNAVIFEYQCWFDEMICERSGRGTYEMTKGKDYRRSITLSIL
jgi:hypothetical protein